MNLTDLTNVRRITNLPAPARIRESFTRDELRIIADDLLTGEVMARLVDADPDRNVSRMNLRARLLGTIALNGDDRPAA